MPDVCNIASTLSETAAARPDQHGVVWPAGRDGAGQPVYRHITFRQLDELSDSLARGLCAMGVSGGARLVLMVRPGVEFIALTYAVFKAGAVVVLIDPGMGPRRVFRCLDQIDPQGFIAVPTVQALRVLSGRRFAKARLNVTVGRRWFWAGATYDQLARGANVGGTNSGTNPGAETLGSPVAPPPLCKGGAGGVAPPVSRPPFVPTLPTDLAAIIFTSGSTGPAKGVVYEHGMFAAQVEALREHYAIEPGGIDVPGFPLFALFNAAMGMTTVIPDIDPTRPAQADPKKFVEALESGQATQSFASPAIWKRVGEYCEAHDRKLPTLNRVFSAGAPVAPGILSRMRQALSADGAQMFTPYGATEALPVCSISANEVLTQTAEKTRDGAGTCVGRPFSQVQLTIIEIADRPLASWAEVRELPLGEIGEIVVRGKMVTREYFRRPDATARAKIYDTVGFWHRMGDVGYLDADGRLWFCGRMAHVVDAEFGRMFTECVEPVFNTHPRVYRTALVGVGPKPRQTPVVVVETEPWYRASRREIAGELIPELREIARSREQTANIERFLIYPGALPVDVRHNIKINREQIAQWASRQPY